VVDLDGTTPFGAMRGAAPGDLKVDGDVGERRFNSLVIVDELALEIEMFGVCSI